MQYLLHGLRVESDHPLPGLQQDPALPADVRLTQLSKRPDERGTLICEVDAEGGLIYQAYETANGVLLTLEPDFAFLVASDMQSISWWMAGPDPELLSALVAGNVLSLYLQLQGHYVGHASAVLYESMALAFAGGRGAGKTTLAARFVTAGAKIITDDALRIDPGGGAALCHSGSSTLRLRFQLESVGLREVPGTTTSFDGRFLAPVDAAPGRHPLHAILLPRVEASEEGLRLRRLDPLEATKRLLAFVRWFGWKTADLQRQQLFRAADIAAATPVFELALSSLTVPGVVEQLVKKLRASDAAVV